MQYSFPDSVLTATSVDSGIIASDVNGTGSSASVSGGFTLPASVFLNPTVASPTVADAIVNNQYLQFSITPSVGNAINLEQLTFDSAKGGSSTRGFALRSSLDGFAATISTADVASVAPTITPFIIDLSGSEFQDIDTQMTFRFYVYSPNPGATMFFDNIILNGSVVAVPEPSSALLLGLGAFVLSGYRRRTR